MGKEPPARSEGSVKTPADEVEIKKSFRGIKKVISGFLNEFHRKRNRNSLWKF